VRSLPILTQVIESLGKVPHASLPRNPQSRPSALTPRWTNDPQRGSGLLKRHDPSHRNPAIGQDERPSPTHRTQHPAGLIAQLALRQTLDRRLGITQGLGKVVVSGVWLGVMGAWGLWILG